MYLSIRNSPDRWLLGIFNRVLGGRRGGRWKKKKKKKERRREGEEKGKIKTKQRKLKNSFCINRRGRDLRKEFRYQGPHTENR